MPAPPGLYTENGNAFAMILSWKERLFRNPRKTETSKITAVIIASSVEARKDLTILDER